RSEIASRVYRAFAKRAAIQASWSKRSASALCCRAPSMWWVSRSSADGAITMHNLLHAYASLCRPVFQFTVLNDGNKSYSVLWIMIQKQASPAKECDFRERGESYSLSSKFGNACSVRKKRCAIIEKGNASFVP